MIKIKIEIEKLKAIKGEELKYNQLCKRLDLPIRYGNSKKSQLNNLRIYCNLKALSSPTRYIITEVYEEGLAFLGIDTIHGNNKFQLLFEAALYREFIKNKGKSLYLSDMDLLKLFNEINDNFSYTCNLKNMIKMGKEYTYMTPMGHTVYKILRQWTRRRLEGMEKRKIILSREGFRLYKKITNEKGNEITLIKNVDIDSKEEKICQEIYIQSYEKIMPEDWNSEDKGKYWVPEWRWISFENKIKELVEERFNGEYNDLKCIKIISPPSLNWLKDKLEKINEQIACLETNNINLEVQKKIMSTSQLDNNTNLERKKFIEMNIKKEPPVLFKEALKEIKR